MYLETLFSSLLELFLLVALGYGIRKIKLVGDKTIDELSEVLLKVILPLSVVSSGFDSTGGDGKNLVLSFLIISLCYIFFFVFSFLVLRVFVKEKGKRNICVNMCVFANTSFIGIPLTQVLFGSSGMIYAVVYNLMYNVFMFTYGITLFQERKEDKVNLKNVFLDPLTVSSLVAILLFLFPIAIPSPIKGFLSSVGAVSGPLSMMLVGSWLMGVNGKKILIRPLSYLVSFLRLMILPLLVYFALSILSLDNTMKNTIVLMSALPIGTLNVIFAKKYGGDATLTNETMMQSLILSLVTIPLIVLLFH